MHRHQPADLLVRVRVSVRLTAQLQDTSPQQGSTMYCTHGLGWAGLGWAGLVGSVGWQGDGGPGGIGVQRGREASSKKLGSSACVALSHAATAHSMPGCCRCPSAPHTLCEPAVWSLWRSVGALEPNNQPCNLLTL